jgi:hypothetical protein
MRVWTFAVEALAGVLLLASSGVNSANAAFSDFGIASLDASLSTTQAGAHPDFTTLIEFKTDPGSEPDSTGLRRPYARPDELTVDAPPGLVGNLNAVATCTSLQLAESRFGGGCPIDSQVGLLVARLYGLNGPFVSPIYNMQGSTDGSLAQFGAMVSGVTVLIDINVRSDSDYGISATVKGISARLPVVSLKTTLWGVPADPSHNTQRLTFAESAQLATESPPRPSGLVPVPFMTNPTSCGGALTVGVRAASYQLPGQPPSTATTQLPAITGCGRLGFQASLSVTPTSHAAASPSGLDAVLNVPQNETVKGLATSQLRNANVSLPDGVAIATGAADGLEACSALQVGYRQSPPGEAHCPPASKIGSAEFDVAALSRVLSGEIYQRTPEPGDLFHIWLVTDDMGAHVKIPGEIAADPVTGRLTASFVDNPQVPLRELKLHFKGGARGVLATPSRCGIYETVFELTAWAGLPPVAGQTPMSIDENCNTGSFSPRFSAGTTNPTAGRFASLAVDFVRESDEQNLARLDLTMPKGVLAKLAGVALCPAALARSGNCPRDSQIGTTAVATGPGPSPLWIPQPGKDPTAVYLAGPYRGAPYSIVVKTPAQAGPFDLGTVAVRAAVQVDPETTQVSVLSDPLPQILEGVPISYRTVHVDANRRDFALNPTSCRQMSARAKMTSSEGAVANASDRFQVGSCDRLPFRPRVSLRLSGKTNRGAHPRLRAVLTMPRGGANIAKAQVALPHSEFLDNAHIRTVCTRVQFAADECPPGSIYGHATAVTPLLSKPLSGPVYLRSSNHKLPDLVADLGGEIEVVLDGRIDSRNGGIRTTFATVPDAPVSKFVLEMKGGRRGLLQNSTSLCRTTHRASAKFDAQNGRVRDWRPILKDRCGRLPD